MMELAENLCRYRKQEDMTQEEVAEALGVAPQTVSKWERGETDPDILLLPALAHLFGVSTDALLGMDQLSRRHQQGSAYTEARMHLRRRDWPAAIAVYEEALRIWPGDQGLMCDLAMALALQGGAECLRRAAELCSRVLEERNARKVQHTARAALCYIYQQMGEAQKAQEAARQLPHTRESREVVLAHLQKEPSLQELNAWMFELSTGENW